MAGANAVYGSGMLELGMTFSMEQLVIDNEMITMFKKAMEGVEVSDETIRVDAIKEIGASGDFIAHPSTIENIDIQSKPTIFNRGMLGEWRAAGSKNVVEVAHEVVVDVMENYQVLPIPDDVLKEMEKIVKRSDEDYKKQKAN